MPVKAVFLASLSLLLLWGGNVGFGVTNVSAANGLSEAEQQFLAGQVRAWLRGPQQLDSEPNAIINPGQQRQMEDFIERRLRYERIKNL